MSYSSDDFDDFFSQNSLAQARQQLALLIKDVSKLAGNIVPPSRNEVDEVSVTDPFNRSRTLQAVPKAHRSYLAKLLDGFEESLIRVLSLKGMNQKLITGQYQRLLFNTLADKYGSEVLELIDYSVEKPYFLSKSYRVKSSTISVNERSATESNCSDISPSSHSPPEASSMNTSNVCSVSEAVMASPDSNNNIQQKKRRRHISKEARSLLEKAFETTKNPTRKERAIIAEKSGMTALQVRVWFTNKRMRTKTRI